MITVSLLRSWGACWDDERIFEHASGRTVMTPREVAADETIELDDRLWVLANALQHRDEPACRMLAIDLAAETSPRAGSPADQAEHAMLCSELRRIYTLPAGQRETEIVRWDAALAGARDAAWDAALAGARDAALAGARDAARAAAWDAARAAALAGARDAARAAAWDAALDAAIRSTMARILLLLGDDADGWSS